MDIFVRAQGGHPATPTVSECDYIIVSVINVIVGVVNTHRFMVLSLLVASLEGAVCVCACLPACMRVCMYVLEIIPPLSAESLSYYGNQ